MFTKGGHKATAGTYWNMANGSRIDMVENGVLPGGDDTRYVKAPSAVVLLAGPVLGLIFAVFLPFIGIAMAAMLLIRKIGEGVRDAAVASATFGWKPVEAYLAGRKHKKEIGEKKREKKS